MKIPEGVIERFIRDEFPEVKNADNGELRINTPFSSSDGKFRLYINLKKGTYFDQKNQTGNTFINFVQEYKGFNKAQALQYLITSFNTSFLFGDINEEIMLKDVIQTDLEIPKGLKFFEETNSGLFRQAALNYLEDRKISPDGLGFIVDNKSPYDERIFVPFYEDEKLVYFITRTWDENNSMRYVNPDVPRKSVVFNIDKINDEVFIFEGVFDALSLSRQIGTCLLGARLSKEQAIKIWDRAPKRIIFVPDTDETGKNTLKGNIKTLINFKPSSLSASKIYIYNIPKPYKDFNEMKVKNEKSYIEISECEEYNTENKIKEVDNIIKGLKF